MKKILAFILTALLFCGTLAPFVLAEEPATETEITEGATDSDGGAGSDDNLDADDSSDTEPSTEGEESESADEDTATEEPEDTSVPEGFDYTDSVISYIMPDALMGTFEMNCGDTTFTQLHSTLDTILLSGTVEKDGTPYEISLPIVWDFTAVDAETPNSYTVVGSISIPEDGVFADGLESTLSILVQVTAPLLTVAPSAITLTSFDAPYPTDAVAFAVDTTQEELVAWFADCATGFSGYDAEGNFYDLAPGTWSLDAVDTSTVGIYYASVTPELGTEYTLAEGISLPLQLGAVSIQVIGEPDINCCLAGRGFLHFPWIISSEQEEQLDEFAVWLRQDDGDWISLSDGFLLISDGLQLSQRIFTYGSTYDLKVTYPGGQTGVLTFQYDGELSIIDYSTGDRDGGDADGNDSGAGTQPAPTTPSDSNEGDSSGGGNNTTVGDDSSSKSNDTRSSDATSQKPQEEQASSSGEAQPTPIAPQTTNDPQNSQIYNIDGASPVQAPVTVAPPTQTSAIPAKSAISVFSNTLLSYEAEGASPIQGSTETQWENGLESQEPAALSESYSPIQTVISGVRLRDLCKDEDSVVFGSGDLTVSIPSNVLLSLNLAGSDTLSVGLTQPKDNQIMFSVEVFGKTVTELAGTVLRLRYTPQSENSEITVRNEMGEQITDASYDGELLRFTADAAGTYTILEVPKAQEAQKNMTPLLSASGGIILAAGGISLFRRRLHG